MRDEDRRFEQRAYLFGEVGELGRAFETLAPDPVDVMVANALGERVGADVGLEPRHLVPPNHLSDAHLDGPVPLGIEPGHLEIDERERGFVEGYVPHAAARRFRAPRRHCLLRRRMPPTPSLRPCRGRSPRSLSRMGGRARLHLRGNLALEAEARSRLLLLCDPR